MARTLSQIENDALGLPPKDRAKLIEQLISTLDTGEDEDVEELWLDEAEKRYDAYRSGKVKAKPSDRVFASVRDRLK
ncbi:addiction module antitoxin RelB [candidate division LCP-89 bacterium B3_LCP]|uniref:Addiction module antitoxin RelB n=1 Tax=candidate division LCP-89 bacterium B3_LCP TaxID=2012998 RepID=A0A532UST8_UNCL8|nr:MAG: addiction module antitoxin RelB [candidate division LCP-89 bacterium B3_LCP]